MARAHHDPSARRPRGPEDAWVDGAEGRYWGTYGAAGLLLAHPEAGVLLQLRVEWSHFGGTWGLPGGARKAGETPEEAAIREADEEASVPPDAVEVLATLNVPFIGWEKPSKNRTSVKGMPRLTFS